ncbi:hypothetical protein [Jannaschia seohaensis]|uniref:Glycosyl hydrolase catalytic core n=1 Tax=Jannaschia seohaensis TaxID=475081 RepID=A0A2Y9A1Z0_9RHOB|nr:hypothetical protein [Jannaschia seohaensis]PWJ22182.1 hypothetical protein BCF38_101592 [Jannaschia seohaensis]SSA38460.1 hypothetical protein SAMN05421539_101592 [Jannaschia seohaensis]
MRWVHVLFLTAALAGAAPAQELRGPDMAVASNFGQGMPLGLLQAAVAAGIADFRDAVYWDRVEGPDGRFRFVRGRDTFPARLPRMSLTVNNGHPAYEEGATPVTPEGIAAFGRHAAETAARFPTVDAVEIGNEINSENFVTGPLRAGGLVRRAEGYTALLESVARQVRAVRPDVRILGGALHSLPTGYTALLDRAGAFAHMDALAFHPYDTPPEVLPAQVAEMRRLPALAEMPFEITEYGTPDAEAAPALLLKMHCMAALSGVTRLAWYPLHPRGDGFAPVLTRAGEVTELGRAYLFVQDRLAGLPVTNAAPDAFARGCRYGDAATVIWGAPREVILPPGARTLGPNGTEMAPVLSEEVPLLVLGPPPTLGPVDLLADSFLQFGYPGKGFTRLARNPLGVAPLVTMPGQGRSGVPWTPYLGRPDDPGVRLLSRSLLPSGTAAFPVEVVHRYVAPAALEAELDLMLHPAARSVDGVRLTVSLDGAAVTDLHVTERHEARHAFSLAEGSVLEIAVGPGDTALGDVTGYRFTLRAR